MSSMVRALPALALAAFSACAQQPAPVVHYSGDSPSLALSDARAIEAAKQHPNALPRVRPQYPEHAPPPLAPGSKAPETIYATRRAASKAADRAAEARDAAYERTLYERSSYGDYRYGYGYNYRRPFFSGGWGAGWGPYDYGYYGGYPGYRYGYGLSLGASLWGPRSYQYPTYGRLHWPGRFGWDGPRHGHWGSHHGGWGGGGWRGGASLNTRWIDAGRSGRRR